VDNTSYCTVFFMFAFYIIHYNVADRYLGSDIFLIMFTIMLMVNGF